VWLTAAGQKLVPLAEDLVERFDSLSREMLAMNRKSISIGHQRSTPDYLVKRVQELAETHSNGLPAELTVGHYRDLAEAVRREDLDLTLQFLLDGPVLPELDFAPVQYFDLVIAVSEENRGRFGDTVHPQQLANETILLTSFSDDVTNQFKTLFLEHGVSTVRNQTDSLELALDVASGNAVALTVDHPAATFTKLLSSYRLSMIPLEGLDVVALTGLVWSKRRVQQDPPLAELTRKLKVESLIASSPTSPERRLT